MMMIMMILLTRRAKGHRRTRNYARHQRPSIRQAQVEIPESEEQCQHLPPQPHIFGRDLFAGPPVRNIVYPKPEFQNNNNLSLQREARPHLDVTVSAQVPVREEKLENNSMKITDSTITTNSMLPWLDQFHRDRANEFRDVNMLIEYLIIKTQLQQQFEN
jgi:hypothetical protein